MTMAPPLAAIDQSGMIAAGGVAQQIAPYNVTRRAFYFYNSSNSILFVSLTRAASVPSGSAVAGAASIAVASGQDWQSPGLCPTGAISVIGATTGQTYTAWEV